MSREIILYNSKLKELARRLRKTSTLAEILLWKKLKGRQMCGYDFHRQKPIDNYIVDFFCNELMLAIEIDGSSHGDNEKKDEIRQEKLESLGIKFLRFSDRNVKTNLQIVLDVIRDWITECAFKKHTPAFGHPSPEGNKKSPLLRGDLGVCKRVYKFL